MTQDTTIYSADHIQVLEGLEAVKKRPAMYIGDLGKRGLHHLVEEIVDNSIDEALAGYCKNIEISINSDGSVSVKDDGRGIPVDMHHSGKSALEVVATTLHAGGKFDKGVYKISGGLHGVGISVVNALSEYMEVTVRRDGKAYYQKYINGKPQENVKAIGETSERGTMVNFKPSHETFPVTVFDFEYLKERIMELAFLNKGLRIILSDEISQRTETFHYEGGLIEFVNYLNKARMGIHPAFYFTKTAESVEIEISLQYTAAYNEMIYSFVNDIKTIEGGSHLSGFKTALTRAINDYLATNVKNSKKAGGNDVLEGLTAIISVKVPEPQFEGQTKTKLGNSEIKGIVDSVAYEALKSYFEENPEIAKRVSEKVMSSINAREAAQKAKDLIRRKTVFESSILPGKLSDCSERDPALCELYFVEGDSAGGSCKNARDRRFQAILPLKGKILNVEKAPIHKALSSEEIKAIALSLGAGFGDDFDVSKVRYHKCLIMTDADVDGSHIRTLLLTLFYRYFKELIEKGYLYVAQPPLYKIKKGKGVEYAYSDDQLNQILHQYDGKAELQRYKGLGEMNPDQLWETTMDPENRTLKQVTIEDARKADELFTILMGTEVEPRRDFIQTYAKEVKNLDI
ncbi:MAG TPA: DNA topoisomerase (ATP-hydrolyzing) subunit B [Candidatus Bilamarchaeaceae archaeon]|nr:DNA topoisomerase (ATP-hydrolyzing) subunit B [Candidatus Bilamarchaeaceae archaeon]